MDDDDDRDGWLELDELPPGREARAARCLCWRRRPPPRWRHWRSMQLRSSTRKRQATWVQPHPRWRHADGREADRRAFRENVIAWLPWFHPPG